MKKLAVLIISLFLMSACGNSPTNTNANKPPTEPETLIDRNNPLGTPMSSIAYQFELVKAGDYDKLVDCFTEKAKKKVSREAVEKARETVPSVNFDDLVTKVVEEENSNGKFAHIKMKDHRTLTILVFKDGKWLSDTAWFQ